MPTAPMPPCRRPGCPQLSNGSGFCVNHVQAQGRIDYQIKGSRRDRGYPADWESRRARILRRDPVCCGCRVKLSTEVDHILRLERGGTNADVNLQGLCKSCHSIKTAIEARLMDPVAVMAALREKVAYIAPIGVRGVKSSTENALRTAPPPKAHARDMQEGGDSAKSAAGGAAL